METTFTNCTFLEVNYNPNKMKSKAINGTGNNYDGCTFLYENKKPAILFIIPKQKWYKRILNILKSIL